MMPYLSIDELSKGIVVQPEVSHEEAEAMGGSWYKTNSIVWSTKRGRIPTGRTRIVIEVPEKRVQCEEALLDRTTKQWECLRTGPECGTPGKPACVAPKASTYVEDIAFGVVRLPVTPTGEVIYDTPKPIEASGPKSESDKTAVVVGVIAVGILAYYLLAR